MSFESITTTTFISNEERNLETIKTLWNEIPLINDISLDEIKDGALVRFKGMIQDMLSPEYYLDLYEVENISTKEKELRNGKYGDLCSHTEDERVLLDSASNVTKERQTLFVISIPGLNNWTLNKSPQNLHNALSKPGTSTESQSSKRKLESDNDMETSSSENIKKIRDSNPDTQNTASGTKHLSPEYLLNFPIPNSKGKACLVKIYDSNDSFKVNDMFELVGFISLNSPIVNESSNDVEMDLDMEHQINNPPPSLIPKLHVVTYKQIVHNNPLIIENEKPNIDFAKIRKDLHIVLTQLLLGDELAAEYLICHLISKVYLRRDMLSLGQCSLNISNVPVSRYADYVKSIYEVLENITTKSHYFPMTLENMNSLAFTPKKDYECNRLVTGLLQLSTNTHLVIDETKLSAGQLNQGGLANIKALTQMIRHQRANYDFKYFQMEYDTDIPVLIFSEGKSLVNCDLHVPLVPDSQCIETFKEILDAAKFYLNEEMLNNIRIYLTNARLIDCELTDEIQDVIQEDFVQMRQNDLKINGDDLHELLVLTRLVSISEGKSILSGDSWKKVQQMEMERKARIQATKRT